MLDKSVKENFHCAARYLREEVCGLPNDLKIIITCAVLTRENGETRGTRVKVTTAASQSNSLQWFFEEIISLFRNFQ